MATDYKKIVLKNSQVPGAIPIPDFLDHGELALNYADNKIYYKTLDSTIVVHETPDIDVDPSPNSIVRRNLNGSGSFNGVISESIDADIYSIYASHNTAATAKFTNTGVCAGAEISSALGHGAEISSIFATGAIISSQQGAGARIYSTSSGTGAEISSESELGAKIYTNSGTYHATFGNISGTTQLGISNAPDYSIDWLTLSSETITSTGKLKSGATTNQTWTLPNASGTIALTSDITSATVAASITTSAHRQALFAALGVLSYANLTDANNDNVLNIGQVYFDIALNTLNTVTA